jgi:hypothetical protein
VEGARHVSAGVAAEDDGARDRGHAPSSVVPSAMRRRTGRGQIYLDAGAEEERGEVANRARRFHYRREELT